MAMAIMLVKKPKNDEKGGKMAQVGYGRILVT
jgi:hypothetical protein